MLLVIDDVWEPRHLAPFMIAGPNCARLVTTRDEGVLAPYRDSSKSVCVDAMMEDEAIQLIAAGLDKRDVAIHRDFLTSLANRLGRCALLLELANGRMWAWARDRGGIEGAIDEAEIEFRFKGVTAFDRQDRPPVDLSNPATRNEAYDDSISASLSLLSDDEKVRFFELAIFPEDVSIPYSTIALYWNQTAAMNARATSALLDRLKRLSLLKGVTSSEGGAGSAAREASIRLHDVIRSYVRSPERTKTEVLQARNRLLWVAHINAVDRLFDGDGALAAYAYAKLSWHLVESGNSDLLDSLSSIHPSSLGKYFQLDGFERLSSQKKVEVLQQLIRSHLIGRSQDNTQ